MPHTVPHCLSVLLLSNANSYSSTQLSKNYSVMRTFVRCCGQNLLPSFPLISSRYWRMLNNMPWKTIQEDGGEWHAKWHRSRLANLLRISGQPPKTLCIDEVNLIVCCRYAESLI